MWQVLFWLSVAVIFYAYAGYPLLLLVLGAFRRDRHRGRDGHRPSVCLIICAFNEESVIRQKIENSLSLKYPADRFTIVVASDGSTDGTVDIARAYENAGVTLRAFPQRRGKSAVLNEVIRDVAAEVLVFTDANAFFEADAIEKLVAPFHDARVGSVVGRLRYHDLDATSVGRGEGIYWRYEGVLQVLESRLGSVLVANGSIFAARRSLVRELYPEVANDFQIPFDVASAGYEVVYRPNAVAIERTADFCHEEFGRKVRIVMRGLSGYALLHRRVRGLRAWQFWSHKMLRWFVAFFVVLILVSTCALSAAGNVFATAVLVAQTIFYAAAALGWITRRSAHPIRIFYLPFYFTMVNAAAMVAVARFMAGGRLSVWEKAESTRARSAIPPVTRPRFANEKSDARAKTHSFGARAAKP